jgi:hypothetical protein
MCGAAQSARQCAQSALQYALSNRLVDGIIRIHQCRHRYVQSTTTVAVSESPRGTATLDNDQTDDAAADASAPLFPVPEADTPTAGAFAQLAWTIHVTIPLESRMLSNYRPEPSGDLFGKFHRTE